MSGGLRFAPAPPNVSCVPASGNLYPSGPSPYTCPGVDKPPDTPYPSYGMTTRFKMPVRAALLDPLPLLVL